MARFSSVDTARRQRKAEAFRALHEGEPFVIPNPWDAGSARVLEQLGYEALATTSSGFAFTLGRADGNVTLAETVEHTARLDEATELLVGPIRRVAVPTVIVDLKDVDYFGSSFLTLLLRCSRAVQDGGGQMALAGVSTRARELLHLTSLDIVWPIYEDRAEALEALSAD